MDCKLDIFGEQSDLGSNHDILFKLVFGLPINWVGNKKRMLSHLLSFMVKHHVEHQSFLDVFAGSGVVSLLAASSGKKVFSNDLLTLSSTWLLHLLSREGNPLSVDESHALVFGVRELKEPPTQMEFLSKIYNGALLTTDEVSYLDAYRRSVSMLFGNKISIGFKFDGCLSKMAYLDLNNGQVGFDPGEGNPTKASFAMQMMCVHILQQAFMGGRCYKSQLLAISEKRLKAGKIGHDGNTNAIGNENSLMRLLKKRTCPTQKMSDYLSKIPFESTVFNCDAEQFVEHPSVQVDLAYFDPPYGGYNSDYAWMYRVCEEFLTGVRLEDSEDLREASVKFKGNDYERDKAFASKKRQGYANNFASLLEKSAKFPLWMISFNESSFTPIDDIIDIVGQFRSDIVVETIDGYRYNYREKTVKNGSEYVMLAKRH